MAPINYFPPNVIRLQEELVHHPQLQRELASEKYQNDWSLRLAGLAAKCNIALHGDYGKQDIDHIAGLVVGRLRAARQKGELII